MEEGRFARLAAIMAAMAGGDRAAVVALYREFGAQLASVLRAELRRQGVHFVSADDLDGLVFDTCMVLEHLAGSWDPTRGVLPWTWAKMRLRTVVSDFVGVHADEFDPDRHDRSARAESDPLLVAADDRDDLEVFAGLAHGGHELAELLAEAFTVAAIPERARRIVMSYQLQMAEHDPSPSRTVASRHDMRPDAVRQVVARTRRKLRALTDTEPRFAPLAVIPLVA